MTIQPITIANRQIGPGHPPWIVAEMSANHGRSFDRAVAIIDAAATAEADAVKVQAFSAEEMSIDREAEWQGKPLTDLYRQAAMPYEWLPELKAVAEGKGLVFFASVFSPHGVELVENLIDPPCYKIASFELTCEPILKAVAATGKPVILSAGMATYHEIDRALAALEPAGKVALLHCVSAYPAPVHTMGLSAIPAMHERFGVPVGLSDHSVSGSVGISAVALGASIIELHVTLADGIQTLDSGFSLSTGDLRLATKLLRETYSAVWGFGDWKGARDEEEPALALRRSIYATADIARGEAFTTENIACLRPDKGLPPDKYEHMIASGTRNGGAAAKPIKAGEPIQWEHIGGDLPGEWVERDQGGEHVEGGPP